MQVPIRKPGKYTHTQSDPHLTETKFSELKNTLEKLKKSQRGAIEEVKRLAAHGDFSENHAYQMAKGRLRGINQRIAEIENDLNQAIIIKPTKNTNTVQLGNRVTVQTSNKTQTFQILGSAETDPRAGIISHNSPIGAALIGRRVGDIIIIKLTNKTIEYTITKIE
ncbi:MAG: GreA/GreB family elongation factor [Patescibacteria group bacterium]